MTKPKVLFILHLPPPMHGAAMMGSYIKQSGIINADFDADYIDLATNRVLSESGKGSFRKVVTFAGIARKIIGALSSKKYDLCYMTLTAAGPGFYKDAMLVSLIKLFNKKIIYHFHNKGVSNSKSRLADRLYKYVFRNTKSILISPNLYYDIKDYVSEKDVFYCSCGIPVERPYEEQKKLMHAKHEGPCRLLFLSNMILEKGIFVLLDACEQLNKANLRFECHFVGGWFNVPEEDFTRAIREKGLTEVVFTHGPKYNEDKQAFYQRADVFVLPTFYDTFGLVNLEAMQNGLAIVSTPEGGIPDIIVEGETGYLVPQHDATALAEKLTILLKDSSLRYQMGEAGMKRFYELFTLEKFEKNISHILKTTISQN